MRESADEALARAAARFDAVYTDMTLLQRELLDATRAGVDAARARELSERAFVMAAAVSAAESGLALGQPAAREVEAAALRARILASNPDPILLTMALRAQRRREAYALLADVLERAADDGTVAPWFQRTTLTELLGAPRGMGRRTAATLIDRWGRDPNAAVDELAGAAARELASLVRDAAEQLPDGILPQQARHTRGPDDGRGAGGEVLAAWVDAIGAPASTARAAAIGATEREGWPRDAAAVALELADFAEQQLAPRLIPEWERIVSCGGDGGWIPAARAQRRQWWASRTEDGATLAWLVDLLIGARRAADKAASLAGEPPERWGSQTPLAQARTAARRCGDLIGACEPDAVAPLLAELPSTARGRAKG